jgi:hypothetical protein
MRLPLSGAGALGLALALSGCLAGSGVDPDDAAPRAAAGAVLGAGLGAGIGSVYAINPILGAGIGAEAGAALGMAAGVVTAQPAVGYAPIAVPQEAAMPGFYDGWAPGSYGTPAASAVPPPLPKAG